jgi:hypothetical protein
VNVVDSSGWIEYFANAPGAEFQMEEGKVVEIDTPLMVSSTLSD